ncbi:MAG: GH32 C-terminal domain-containing protein [Planctomycetes bacterium]|nr:GH32 C-terminal domain-containing protein [Planctomycetota bacterium]
MQSLKTILASLTFFSAGLAAYAADSPQKQDKTLLVWVAPSNLNQQGGSALTIQSGDRFDAVVLGERVRGKWMAGSDMYQRTEQNQGDRAAETADPQTFVQIAVVYREGKVLIYRNGELYADYPAQSIDLLNLDNHIAIFGLRHLGNGVGTPLAGMIDDARIYARALTQDEIKSLKPNVASSIEPLAWWDFEGKEVKDRAGRFTHNSISGNAKVDGGRLVLDGKSYLIAGRSANDVKRAAVSGAPRAPQGPYAPETPAWPANPPANWLTYHLAHPGPGPALPGDPNCAFDHKGRVHLHYIYRNHTGFVFAHVSSDDMVHWTWHPTILAPPTTGHGMFSGTGFYTKDGKPGIIYHGQGSGRNWIQFPKDDQFMAWNDPIAVVPKNADGSEPKMRHWDPDLWLNGDTYYALSGGKNPQLMKSADLENWTYLGDVLHKDYPANLGIPKDEDISCANMFKIGNKWMLLCISHPKGCRYYLGDFKDEKYLPDYHAMMSWGSNQFFAPESILTRDGRRVMWAWIMNMPIAPTGVQSLPRELELPADGVLRIKPLRELSKLRYDEKAWQDVKIADGREHKLEGLTGDAIELEVKIAAPVPKEIGLYLLGDENGKEEMSILTGSGRKGIKVGSPDAPFQLAHGEELTLRVFIDKGLVEVFANDRQAVAYGHGKVRANPNIRLFSKGGEATVKSVKAWKMKSIYQNEAKDAAAAKP